MPNDNNTALQGANAYSEGYFYGVLDIYYAVMKTPDGPKVKPTYDPYEVLGKTIEVTITPNYKEGKVFASNVATRNEKRVDSYTVSINLDKVPYAVREEILGRMKDSNGVQIIKGSQIAPYVAIAFALTLDDGSKELWTLYKGKFSEMSQTGHTDSDERHGADARRGLADVLFGGNALPRGGAAHAGGRPGAASGHRCLADRRAAAADLRL